MINFYSSPITLLRLSREFSDQFSDKDPLGLQFTRPQKGRLLEVPHPFFEIYKALKQKTLQIIGRNHFFAPAQEGPVFLCTTPA